MSTHTRKIAVIGLGYVGLPLACEFGFHQSVIGFDLNEARIQALKAGVDHTGEISSDNLTKTDILLTTSINDLKQADFYIITVPTPINRQRQPDLTAMQSASKTIGAILKVGDIVVYESTVYPGLTEEICLPILEAASGLTAGVDFHLGYSPERINPGDHQRRLTNITKIVSADDEPTLDIVADVYGQIIKAGIHRASSIKVAEAAKVIENTQRDLNIALVNELALIFDRLDINTSEVLEAAGTKWNFLPFRPGLVGGHCIGVDPYYLTFRAQQAHYQPEVILAGRKINDRMAHHIATKTMKLIIHSDAPVKGANIAVLGLTFKENCRDFRNSKSFDVIHELQEFGANVVVHDPYIDTNALKDKNLAFKNLDELNNLDALVLCVPHQEYLDQLDELLKKLKPKAYFIDVKGVFKKASLEQHNIWQL
jgi:UDP-N-acetyl-D-glucosamine/UDP-N-acetyl-D-galactosamine dehydrogenase